MSSFRRTIPRLAAILASLCLTACDYGQMSYENLAGKAENYAHVIDDQLIPSLTAVIGQCTGGPEILTSLKTDSNAFHQAALTRPAAQDLYIAVGNAFNETSDDVDAAYDVAVRCGTADPHIQSLAQWHSTYWDYSSP